MCLLWPSSQFRVVRIASVQCLNPTDTSMHVSKVSVSEYAWYSYPTHYQVLLRSRELGQFVIAHVFFRIFIAHNISSFLLRVDGKACHLFLPHFQVHSMCRCLVSSLYRYVPMFGIDSQYLRSSMATGL